MVEEALHRLKSARDGFRRSIDLTLSLFAPVRRLPEDVLVEIFSLYIQDSGIRRGERTYSLTLSRQHRISSPCFTLSRVCSFWQKVVFSRPAFWSSFSLNTTDLRRESKVMTILSECLSRSANAPLSLYIRPGNVDDSLVQKNAFNLFLEQAGRWECLDLFLPRHNLTSRFISWMQSGEQSPTFSSLRHLALDGHFSLEVTSVFQMLLRSSHLETLSTGNLDVPWSDFCQCDFSSLKKLEILGPSEGSVGQLLSRMPSLEVCNLISSFSGSPGDAQPTNTFYSSSLRRLSIDLENTIPESWQSLRTPHLRPYH
ncbi:hypothetical protein GYMLUDRAFT_563052 [Collybiopsis luxurians FD-317 M1]|uniref:F-box domain-containing protein n=1 Tax=Collybiopsis luxurians FD-317 M1 TaxID=944289 RepID=A0A0D0BE87_9AGAR|nr:hypothetical protein GYMLUDRAFT_563052 [Collybiopsis luxurians FD-317 M1]